jgi:uncharacterized protein
MKNFITALIAGALFGAGLVISDMINPDRVLAFLDVTGKWDASLAFVMGGALIPSAIAYIVKKKMNMPFVAEEFHLPTKKNMDSALVMGAALFGIGWGLVGLCPGPALAALITGRWQIIVFVLAMCAGIVMHRFMHEKSVKS